MLKTRIPNLDVKLLAPMQILKKIQLKLEKNQITCIQINLQNVSVPIKSSVNVQKTGSLWVTS